MVQTMKILKFSAMLLILIAFGIGCQKSEVLNSDIQNEDANISQISNRSRVKGESLELERSNLPKFLVDKILYYNELSAKVGEPSFEDRWGTIDMTRKIFFRDEKGDFVQLYFIEQENALKHLLITTRNRDSVGVYIVSENDEITLNTENGFRRIDAKGLSDEVENSTNSTDYSGGCFVIVLCDACPLGWGLVEEPCTTSTEGAPDSQGEGGISSWGGSWFGGSFEDTGGGGSNNNSNGNEDCGGTSGWTAENSDNDFDVAIRILMVQNMQAEYGLNNCDAQWLYDSDSECGHDCLVDMLLDKLVTDEINANPEMIDNIIEEQNPVFSVDATTKICPNFMEFNYNSNETVNRMIINNLSVSVNVNGIPRFFTFGHMYWTYSNTGPSTLVGIKQITASAINDGLAAAQLRIINNDLETSPYTHNPDIRVTIFHEIRKIQRLLYQDYHQTPLSLVENLGSGVLGSYNDIIVEPSPPAIVNFNQNTFNAAGCN